MSIAAAVITVSDRVSAGLAQDFSGPIALQALQAAGFSCQEVTVITDGAEAVESALRAAISGGARLVITTGGTGVGPRDQTPEGTARVLEVLIPGIPEELRRSGVSETKVAILSRGVAGLSAGALVVNLPGSPKAVASGMPVVLSVAGHVIDQIGGGDHR